MTSRSWRLIVAFSALLLPTRAWAHAHLRRSDPSANAHLAAAPQAIHLWFSERPDLGMTGVALKDAQGKSFRLGSPVREPASALEISVDVVDALSPGTYTVEWHTAGSDGHPSHGVFSFVVTGPAPVAAPAASSSSLPSRDVSAPPESNVEDTTAGSASTTQSLLRALSFIALLCVVGAVAFRFLSLPRAILVDAASRADMERRAAIMGGVASVALLVTALGRIWLEADMMRRMSATTSMSATGIAMQSSWGSTMRLQMGAALILLISFVFAAMRSRSAWVLCAAAALVAAITPAMTGHAASVDRHSGLAIVSDFLHVAGAGTWLGTLLCILVVGVPIAMRQHDTARWQSVASLVNSFSPVALTAAGVVAVSGLVASWLHLSHFADLWTTQYGQMLFRKLVFVAVTLAVGAYNNKKVQPRLAAESGVRTLRRTATIELLSAVVVLIFTGFLTGTEP